jgi:hypothetical protein
LGIILGHEAGMDENNRFAPLLGAMLARDDMKTRFVTVMCDLMNSHFAPENVEKAVNQRYTERLNEFYNFLLYSIGRTPSNSRERIIELAPETESLILFGHERPAEMKKQIEKYLDVGPDGYLVTCSPHALADITFNSYEINSDFEGFYYDISTVKVTASRPDGHQFSHWLVNGASVTDEIMEIGAKDAQNGRIHIELVLEPDENRNPLVTLIDYNNGKDYIEIHNPHADAVNLRRFFISDDPSHPYKQILADYILPPGQSLRLYCPNYRAPEALGGFGLSFNIRSGENLMISNIRGEEIFSMELPKMNKSYILVRNPRNGNYDSIIRGEP